MLSAGWMPSGGDRLPFFRGASPMPSVRSNAGRSPELTKAAPTDNQEEQKKNYLIEINFLSRPKRKRHESGRAAGRRRKRMRPDAPVWRHDDCRLLRLGAEILQTAYMPGAGG